MNGRSLARHEDALERLALRLGVRPLIEFFSADENSMSLLIEEGAGNQELMRRLPPPQWYSLEDGLRTVRALLLALEADPQQLGTEGEQVLSELLEYAHVLEKTMEQEDAVASGGQLAIVQALLQKFDGLCGKSLVAGFGRAGRLRERSPSPSLRWKRSKTRP